MSQTNSDPTGGVGEFEFLKKTRGYVRAKVTRMCDNVSVNINNFSLQEKSDMRTDLVDIKSKLNQYTFDISKLICKYAQSDEVLEKELDSSNSYENKLNSTKF